MRKVIPLAIAFGLLAQVASAQMLKPLACRNDAELSAVMRSSFDQIQRDKLKTLPWRVFVVMREFQRAGFIVTPRIHATVCDGDQWLYGDTFGQIPIFTDDPPTGPIQLRDPTWNTIG